MAAAGMCAVLVPLLTTETRADAAQTGANGSNSLMYVDLTGTR
jgi:hypothetical protein